MTINVFHILAAAALTVAPWHGELFDKKQGAFYFQYALKGFKAGKQQAAITGSLSVTVSNILRKKALVFAQDQSDPDELPRQLWKLPAGKYQIKSATLVDAAGVKRTWEPKDHNDFVVKRQSLSNLGLWTFSPEGDTGLSAKLTMTDNAYAEPGKKKDSPLAAVIDGFTGLEQERFAGKRAKRDAEADHSSQVALRATATFTREISMFFRLDLFKYNYHAKAVAGVLTVSDPKMRTCYVDRLGDEKDLKGDVRFTFLLSKQTGTMARLKHTGGALKDAKLVECLYYELAQIQFPVPENMIGELTYSFDVR
jgi:hypothetical protein